MSLAGSSLSVIFSERLTGVNTTETGAHTAGPPFCQSPFSGFSLCSITPKVSLFRCSQLSSPSSECVPPCPFRFFARSIIRVAPHYFNFLSWILHSSLTTAPCPFSPLIWILFLKLCWVPHNFPRSVRISGRHSWRQEPLDHCIFFFVSFCSSFSFSPPPSSPHSRICIPGSFFYISGDLRFFTVAAFSFSLHRRPNVSRSPSFFMPILHM